MNSIVERLHNPFHMHDSKVMHEAADMIESQERRINELEATLDRLYRVGHCGSVDSFLACDDEVKRGYFAMMIEESTDNKKLREELAALRKRIKELEAELTEAREANGYISGIANHTAEQLKDLRKRIDDAPVVAEIGSVQGQTAYVFQTSDRALLIGTKLISREDLL